MAFSGRMRSVPEAVATGPQPFFSPRSGRQHKAWGVSPRSSSKTSIEPATRVIAVALNIRPNDSAAAHFAGFDRVVYEFEGPFPNYRIEYLNGRLYDTEAGRQHIRQAGNVFLQITFFMIPTGDEQLKFTDAKNFVPRGRLIMPSLQSVKDKILFEGLYDFLMGVSSRKPYRVTELSNPSRLVIDFKH